MEFRRILQAVACGLALCLPAVMVRVGLLDDDPVPPARADRAPVVVGQPVAVANRTPVADPVPTSTAALAPGRVQGDPRGRLFAVETPNEAGPERADFPLEGGGAATASGPAGDGASNAGGSHASVTGSAQEGFRSPGAAASFGAGAGAAGPSVVASPATHPASPVDGLSNDDPKTDAGPHDEAHRRGVRSLNGTGSNAGTAVARSSSLLTGDFAAMNDGESGSPREATIVGGLPYMFGATSDESIGEGSGAPEDTTGPAAALVPTDAPTKDLAAMNASPAGTIPEPGTMTLLFLGLLAVSLSRRLPAKVAVAWRRNTSKHDTLAADALDEAA